MPNDTVARTALRERIESWTLGPVFPTLAGIVIFLLAGGVVLFGPEIRAHSRAFLEAAAALEPRRPSVWVLAFWAMGAVVVTLVRARLRAERDENTARVQRMLQAVHRSPNPNVFHDYPALFEQAERHARAPDAGSSAEERRAEALRAIRGVMECIVDLTRYFAQTPERALNAKILLIAEPEEGAPEPYPRRLVETLRFFDHARHRLDGLRALLYLPADLAMADERGGPEPILALPVPHRAETAEGHRIALPGAPCALLTGRAQIHEDTRALARDACADLEKPIRDQIERFYAKGGEGSNVRSVLDIRLGGDAEPVGVLELELDRTHILGTEPDYYVTYFALATPLVRLLARPVAAYAAALREHHGAEQAAAGPPTAALAGE